eukprot:CAMPEP_0202045412 /NCGR_PEP_ID=MMETSP0963-20130614/690_1 /ASSEMBLY_ACC=CAM_ASM_000494 /TAXON_ID=4773 /ORGANISM="Schizochytrium aggregatum, Strain ATCC28209" /LENGTH=160 /DNA_ID=CAMNT_0048609993 /DNA_START=297 /DNA_END=777 /DNA_ORIENTATION=+
MKRSQMERGDRVASRKLQRDLLQTAAFTLVSAVQRVVQQGIVAKRVWVSEDRSSSSAAAANAAASSAAASAAWTPSVGWSQWVDSEEEVAEDGGTAVLLGTVSEGPWVPARRGLEEGAGAQAVALADGLGAVGGDAAAMGLAPAGALPAGLVAMPMGAAR